MDSTLSAQPGRRETRVKEFRFYDQKPDVPDVQAEVLAGLSKSTKTLSPKYFYDETGSRLFDEITRLPEYYLTRTEVGILEGNKADMARWVGDDACLVEYGSGSSVKIRILLEGCRPSAYVPVDISRDHLIASAQLIFDDFDWLSVYPTCADYGLPFDLPEAAAGLPRVAFFPGSSIGNFEPSKAAGFLRGVSKLVGDGGRLVIGVDTKKDTDVLNAAYNDSRGITRAFNLNLLTHLNEVMGANFDIDKFAHEATYNEKLGRIEMYLSSIEKQTVRVNGKRIDLGAGERIHTENSYKYHRDEFVELAAEAGFVCREMWRDERDYFMVLLLEAQ